QMTEMAADERRSRPVRLTPRRAARFSGQAPPRDSRKKCARKKEPPALCEESGGFWFTAGGDLLSRWRSIIGPAGLTAVFGMGTGVAARGWPPKKAAPAPGRDRRAPGSKEDRGSRKRGSAFVWSNTVFGEWLDPLISRRV